MRGYRFTLVLSLGRYSTSWNQSPTEGSPLRNEATAAVLCLFRFYVYATCVGVEGFSSLHRVDVAKPPPTGSILPLPEAKPESFRSSRPQSHWAL